MAVLNNHLRYVPTTDSKFVPLLLQKASQSSAGIDGRVLGRGKSIVKICCDNSQQEENY